MCGGWGPPPPLWVAECVAGVVPSVCVEGCGVLAGVVLVLLCVGHMMGGNGAWGVSQRAPKHFQRPPCQQVACGGETARL